MKLPGPVIAGLLIIALLFLFGAGLGQGPLNLISFEDAQAAMEGDGFNFLRPQVEANDVTSSPACLRVQGGDEPRLTGVVLNVGQSCSITIGPADSEIRTLPLQLNGGQAIVSFVPVPSDNPNAVGLEEVDLTGGDPDLNISVPREGGTVTVVCTNGCGIAIPPP